MAIKNDNPPPYSYDPRLFAIKPPSFAPAATTNVVMNPPIPLDYYDENGQIKKPFYPVTAKNPVRGGFDQLDRDKAAAMQSIKSLPANTGRALWQGAKDLDATLGRAMTFGQGNSLLGAAFETPLVPRRLTYAFVNGYPNGVLSDRRGSYTFGDAWKGRPEPTERQLLAPHDPANIYGITEGARMLGNFAAKKLGPYLADNLWKLNPAAFKPNPEAYYRAIGKEGLIDAIESKGLRVNQNPKWESAFGGEIDVTTGSPYFFRGDNFKGIEDYDPSVIAEVTGQKMRGRSFSRMINSLSDTQVPMVYQPVEVVDKIGKIDVVRKLTNIPLDKNVTILKKNIWSRYKPVQISDNKSIPSEIDWAKWNKEIPTNSELMDEYLNIERTSKANDTWMKNPNGTQFAGTPEQFVQQQSANFKKAFPNGMITMWRGQNWARPELRSDRGVFTGDLNIARHYTAFNKNRILTPNHVLPETDFRVRIQEPLASQRNMKPGVLQLGIPMSDNSITMDVGGKGYAMLKLDKVKGVDAEPLSTMRSKLGNWTTSEHVSRYMKDKDLNYISLLNTRDPRLGTVTVVNHKPGSYMKSLVGNNGMFDMSNPNVFKSMPPLLGGLGFGTLGATKGYGRSFNTQGPIGLNQESLDAIEPPIGRDKRRPTRNKSLSIKLVGIPHDPVPNADPKTSSAKSPGTIKASRVSGKVGNQGAIARGARLQIKGGTLPMVKGECKSNVKCDVNRRRVKPPAAGISVRKGRTGHKTITF